MILLSGKVGYRRLYEPDRVIPGQALFFLPLFSQYPEILCTLYWSSYTDRSPGICRLNVLCVHVQLLSRMIVQEGFHFRLASDW